MLLSQRLFGKDDFSVTDIKPTTGLPIYNWVKELVGDAMGLALVICVLLVIMGAIAFGISKSAGSKTGQAVSGTVVIIGILVGILVGAAPDLVDWGSKEKVVSSGRSVEVVVEPAAHFVGL